MSEALTGTVEEPYRRGAGRKPNPNLHFRLKPAEREAFIENIIAGNTIKTCCGVAGIDMSTFYRWMEKARLPEAGQSLKDFAKEVEKAKSQSEARCVQIIANAAIEQWPAAAWLLERKNPAEWGRRDRVELSGDPEKPIVIGLAIQRVVIERPEGDGPPANHSYPAGHVEGSAPDAGRPAPLSLRGVRDEDRQNGGNGSMDY